MKNVVVEWIDACNYKIDPKVIDSYDGDGNGFLVINKTYGKLYRELEKILIILMEESTNGEWEFAFIPKDWIIDIK